MSGRTRKGFLVTGHDNRADARVVVELAERIVDFNEEGRREGVQGLWPIEGDYADRWLRQFSQSSMQDRLGKVSYSRTHADSRFRGRGEEMLIAGAGGAVPLCRLGEADADMALESWNDWTEETHSGGRGVSRRIMGELSCVVVVVVVVDGGGVT